MAETVRLDRAAPDAASRPEPGVGGDVASDRKHKDEPAVAQGEEPPRPEEDSREAGGLLGRLRRLTGGARKAEDQDKPKMPWYQRIGGRFSDLRSLITNLVTLFVVVALVITVAREVPRNAMIIDPIEAPDALVGEGYKPPVVSQRVMDEMLAIRRAATTLKEGRDVSPEWQQIDIDVPGTGLSVKTILRIVRGLLGFPETRIGGEIVRDGELFRLRLRIAGIGAVAEPEGRPADAIDELINLGARELMRAVDPYILASYLADIDPAAALETIKYCLVNDPPDDDAWAYNLWGLLLVEAESFDEAAEKYALAIEKAPDLALPVNNWGATLYRLKDYEGAIAKYQAALEVDPQFISAYNNWGLALAALEDFAAAIEIYRRAIALDPEHPAAYVNWASELARSDEAETAEEKFRQAISLDPGYARGVRKWGDFLHERGDHRAAIAKYASAAELEPDHAPTLINWGRSLSALGDLDAAEAQYRRAIALEPGNASAYNNLGSILSKNEDYAAAELAFSEAVALDDAFAAAFDNWGIALVKQKKFQAAIEKFDKALQLEPDRYADRQALIDKLQALTATSD